MNDRPSTAELINGILKGIVAAGMLGSILIAPNLAQVGDYFEVVSLEEYKKAKAALGKYRTPL